MTLAIIQAATEAAKVTVKAMSEAREDSRRNETQNRQILTESTSLQFGSKSKV